MLRVSLLVVVLGLASLSFNSTKIVYSISWAADILVVMPRMWLFLFSSTGMVKMELPVE